MMFQLCVGEIWFKDYKNNNNNNTFHLVLWIHVALLCKGFAWREKIGVMEV